MVELNVYNVLGLTSISSNNYTAFNTLSDKAKEYNEDVVFDFYGIALKMPERNEGFKRFMSNPNVHIKLYNDEEKKKIIDTFLIISGIDPKDKVINEIKISEDITSKSDLAINRLANNIASKLFISKNEAGEYELRFRVIDSFTQLGEVDTVRALGKSLQSFIDLYGEKLNHIILDVTDVYIKNNVFIKLASFEREYQLREKGIKYEVVDSKDEEKIKNISRFAIIEKNKSYTPSSKAKLFLSEVPKGSVVMIHRFKETKRVNEFGQRGDGEYFESRAAIFLGLYKNGSEVKLRFKSFGVNTFYTDTQYFIENEVELDKLSSRIDSYSIDDIGYSDCFTGLKCHIHLPFVFDTKDMRDGYFIDGNRGAYKKCILPEYIKLVLDNWNEDYNKECLDKCINISLNKLGLPSVDQR